MYIDQKHVLFSNRGSLPRSPGRQFVVAVVCLCMLGLPGLSLYDDDLTDHNDLPVMALQFLFFCIVVSVAVIWSTSADICCRDAQVSFLISRSPPGYWYI